MVHVRGALEADEPALQQLDAATWTSAVSPVARPVDKPFFDASTAVADVLVAVLDDRVVGYVTLAQPTPIPAHRHVLELAGLAVDPAHQRSGVGRALVDAAVVAARARGARKLSLRVLGTNTAARSLYAACGFVVEGLLTQEFLLEGRYVDDVLMARRVD